MRKFKIVTEHDDQDDSIIWYQAYERSWFKWEKLPGILTIKRVGDKSDESYRRCLLKLKSFLKEKEGWLLI